MTLDEQRINKIKQMEADGRLDPNCPTCVQYFYPYYRDKWVLGMFGPFAPSHKPSPRCQSGGRSHCTCDTCF